MKPWMTEAIGTQKLDLPSSVCQGDLSKGRQVIRSPADPAASLAPSAASYSVGAEGANTTLMPGFLASKAGISLSFQMARSSPRQLSMLSVTSSAYATPAVPRMLVPSSSAVSSFVVMLSLPVDLFQVRF